ncbi:hypothetical protein HK405_015521, partial [Cladochytrium tenue]
LAEDIQRAKSSLHEMTHVGDIMGTQRKKDAPSGNKTYGHNAVITLAADKRKFADTFALFAMLTHQKRICGGGAHATHVP